MENRCAAPMGLMQLMPATARRFGVADVFDTTKNIEGGVTYLRYLLDLYVWRKIPARTRRIHAGEQAVARYQDYLMKVWTLLRASKSHARGDKK